MPFGRPRTDALLAWLPPVALGLASILVPLDVRTGDPRYGRNEALKLWLLLAAFGWMLFAMIWRALFAPSEVELRRRVGHCRICGRKLGKKAVYCLDCGVVPHK